MHTRRQWLAQAGGVPLLAQSAQRRRNVLLLIADDLGLHTGAYGDPVAKTPNLDRMSAEGVRFTNSFCTTASCSPSRSVLLSGLHNHTNGQYGLAHGTHHFAYLDAVRPLPRLLKEAAGYRTGVIGKLHVNPLASFGWDLDQQGETRSVFRMAESAKTFIEADSTQPWYLHFGFGDPHRLGDGFANQAYPGVTRNRFDPAAVRVPSFLPDNPSVRSELAEYYEASNRLDQGVGFLFDILKRTGQIENTLVIFLSDNGMPFANAKTNLYDAAVRLPLIVRAPGQARRGLVNESMVSWTDICPTILDWAGVTAPYPLQGRSLLPILERPDDPERDSVFFSHTFHEVTMYYPMRGMRTRQFKYIRNLFPELEYPLASDLWNSRTWQSILRSGENTRIGRRPFGLYMHRPQEELYDIAKDPDEIHNLAGESGRQAVLKRMRAAVHEFRTRTNDPWTILGTYKGEEPGPSPVEQQIHRNLTQRP